MKAKIFKVVRTITESEPQVFNGSLWFKITESSTLCKYESRELAQLYIKRLMKRAIQEKQGACTNIHKNGFIFWYAGKRFIFEVK